MKLSKVFSNGAVLQRGKDIVLFGTIDDLEGKVTGELNSVMSDAIVTKEGTFSIAFPPLDAGGPYTITLTEQDGQGSIVETLILSDILIGDLFLLSGQSNMELSVGRTLDLYEDEVKDASNSKMRFYQIPRTYGFDGPCEMSPEGEWVEVSKETIYSLSAIGYFFGNRIYDETQVPVGFLATGVGGAHIEAFISEPTLLQAAIELRRESVLSGRETKCICDKNNSCKFCYDRILKEDRDSSWIQGVQEADSAREKAWGENVYNNDPGVKEQWHLCEWETYDGLIRVPGMWNRSVLSDMFGTVWLQTTVNVPKDWCNQELKLKLGTMVDADRTYINGQLVGTTGYRYPPRRYKITPGTLKPGKNIITVCLLLVENIGGFKPDMPYCLKNKDKEISLLGDWMYRVGTVCGPLEGATFFEWKPCGLYNKTIYPYHFLHLSGILFYQGESNSSHPEDYELLMRAMIKDWRVLFGDDVPFVFAQLPDFMGEGDEIGTDRWDRLRRSQKNASDLPNTGLAVLYDLGQYNELHPQNKKEVAERFYRVYCELNQQKKQETD